MTLPPEILFHRYFQHERFGPSALDRRAYRGKQDLDLLPPDARTFFSRLQQGFAEALLNEKQNVVEHKDHPPFHVDYIESTVANAVAFQYEGYSFIGLTVPLIIRLSEVCLHLSTAPAVTSLLEVTTIDQHDALHVVFLKISTSFVISHEYTHHVHGHIEPDGPRPVGYAEIGDADDVGSLEGQIIEADADGYAVYHVLHNIIDGSGRSAVEILKISSRPTAVQDQMLFACCVLSLGGFLFLRPAVRLDNQVVYQLTHPPQAARMNLIMNTAVTWCKQNRPHLVEWMTLERFQILMNAAAVATIGKEGPGTWAQQTEFLKSAEGTDYLRRLDIGLTAHIQSL